MALADILSGIGDVLSAPRRLLYRGLVSPLMGQDVGGFGDVLAKLGMEEGGLRSVLGFLGDVGTDPLTYAGAGLYKYGKGLLGEGAATSKALEGGAATNPGGLLASSAPNFDKAAESAHKLSLAQAAERKWGDWGTNPVKEQAARAASDKHLRDLIGFNTSVDQDALSQLPQINAQRYASLGEMVGKGETGPGLARELAKAQGEHGLLGMYGLQEGAPAAAKTEFAQTLFPKMVESGGLRDLAGETKLSDQLYDLLRVQGAKDTPVVKSLLTPDLSSQLTLQDMLRQVDQSRTPFHKLVDELTGRMRPLRRTPIGHLMPPDLGPGLGSLAQGL